MQEQKETNQQETKNENIEELVPLYYDANVQAKHFKESADNLGKQIKDYCLKNNIKKGEYGALKMSIIVQNRSYLDEEVLLECLLKLPESVQAKVIKTKQYVDPQELEKALFTGVIKPEEVAPAQVNKEVVTLRVSKK